MPAGWIARVGRRLLHRDTFEMVLSPAIADFQFETATRSVARPGDYHAIFRALFGALWFDLSSGWKLMIAIAIAGGIEALLVMGLRRLPGPEGARRALLLRRREGIPYGIAIASGVALMGWWLRS